MSTEEGSLSTEGMYSKLVEDGGTEADEEFGAQPAPSSTGVRGRLAHHGPYKVATACLTAFCLILLMALVAMGVQYNRRDAASVDQNSLKEKNRKLQNEIDQLKYKLEKLETTPTPQPFHCTDDWLYFNGSCYFISMFSRSWMKSQKYCEDKGGHLAIIQTAAEQTFLWNLLPRGHWNSYWFGISDEKLEGDWYWVDGTKLVGGFWEDGEPNNHVNEHCGYIVKTEVLTRVAMKSWYDAPCSMSIPLICERKAAKNTTIILSF